MSKARTSKPRSGGGIRSNKLVRPGMRVAPRTTNVVDPHATDFLGQATSFKKPPFVQRTAPDFAPMGNTMTNNCGPNGEGRTLYARGVQGTHGGTAKGETGIQGAADRGARSILGPQPSNPGKQALPRDQIRRGQQVNE